MQIKTDREARLLPLETALARLNRFPRPKTESSLLVALGEAYKRTLSTSIRAARDVPSFANSAVDGYAFSHQDAEQGDLRVCGETLTGTDPRRALRAGETTRIFTGAPLPPRADTVAMEEDVSLENQTILVPRALTRGANCRPRGDDIKKGTLVMRRGKSLELVDIAVLAALGIRHVPVFPRLSVALFASGSELINTGEELAQGQIYDSNTPMLHRWLLELGCQVHSTDLLPDDQSATEEALVRARNCDLIVASGGMSQSRLDVLSALCASRKSFSFWRVAIKPGRPVGMGRLEGVPFAGLPGNPVACFLTFALLAQPLIRRLSGQRAFTPRRFPAKIGFAWRKKLGRREFVRVKIESSTEHFGGIPHLKKHGKSGAAVLSSVLDADGFAEMYEGTTHYHCGDDVAFLPMREILP